ncbi:MAG: hypothetical protein IPI66_14425 [Chitinophagaceae bacterium]|nr:hypothetical protein [Chitinophagaceae bacterium]MBL0056865.1 hypothetical protein [Chitinophagaceae bacterium]
MKPLFTIIAILSFPLSVICQDITGLWKGTLFNESNGQSSKYEIYIGKEKGKYIAYSQTWTQVADKQYYGIKKINVRIAKDGKVVMQDAKLVENNYPEPPQKNLFQLNVLDLVEQSGGSKLDGPFVTNSSKEYAALTGRINLTRVNSLISQSDLLQYIQKNNIDNGLTAAK